ncbi:MAG: type II toxin-antitoxin system death-on-curing family toxin [Burkholderiaceae bacterium]
MTTAATNWRWISRTGLLRLHGMSLAQFGGAEGVRDQGLPESALDRAKNLAYYGQPDVAELAAAYGYGYGYGLAKNHAFVDGNKRAAFLAVGLFLRLNGHALIASQPDATTAVLAVAAGEMSETEFAIWVRKNIRVL